MTITKKYKFNFENADFCDVDFDNTDFTIFRLMKICEIHFQKWSTKFRTENYFKEWNI
jgi:hypothetical protein